MKYACIDSIERDGEMVSWIRDEAGLTLEKTPAEKFYYCFVPDNTGNTKYQDLFGTPMKKLNFESRWDLKNHVASESYTCESDIATRYKILTDLYNNASESTPFHFCLYDIEVDFDLEDGLGYPKPDNPHGNINLIQAWDTYNKHYTIFALDEIKDDVNEDNIKDEEYDVKFVWCHNERDLLLAFSDFLEPIDIFTAWFGSGFDLPYVMARAEKLFNKKKALTLLSRDGYSSSSQEKTNDFGEEYTHWQTTGRKHIDMQAVYKKFIPKQRQSFKLDAICEEDLGEGKIQYEDEGDLGKLYRSNPEKFVLYGLRDVQLMVWLDRKHNLMQTAFALAVSSGVYVDDICGSVKPIEQAFVHYCRENGNIVLPDKVDKDKQKFPGAIVYHTIAGRHGWSMSADLGALYPSTMVMLGLSPETKVAQLTHNFDDYVKVMENRDENVELIEFAQGKPIDQYEIKASDLKSVIRSEGYTISANGTLFDGRLGVLSAYVKEGIDKRNEAKKKTFAAFQAGNMEEHDVYDLLQKVLKIRNNSVYGCVSNEFFRLFDVELAASITVTGRMISKFQAVRANKKMNELEEELNAA